MGRMSMSFIRVSICNHFTWCYQKMVAVCIEVVNSFGKGVGGISHFDCR